MNPGMIRHYRTMIRKGISQQWNTQVTGGLRLSSVRADLADYELEFSKYMVESNTGCPYGDHASDLLKVEASMNQR